MTSRRLRVLSLDGGGVRGVSALLILKELQKTINEELRKLDESILPKELYDMFDIVVGTSTGGLIALMIVKFRMTVDECIDKYNKLSEEIFGRPHVIGKHTGGFGKPRYSGKRLREIIVNLMQDKKLEGGEHHTMENVSKHEGVVCTVVCRQLENNWTKALKDEAVLLCSHMCRYPKGEYHKCRVCDAARATSAAPTYFKPMRVLLTGISSKDTLVDGGYGDSNNPSFEAWNHYTWAKRTQEIEDEDQVNWINVGTGSKPHKTPPPPMNWTAYLPKFLTDIMHTVRDLEHIATASEKVAGQMECMARNSRRLQFTRFSANTGIHTIGLAEYKRIEEIEECTKRYLNDKDVKRRLGKMAAAFAPDLYAKELKRRAEVVDNTPDLRASTSTARQPLKVETNMPPPVIGVPSMSGRSEPTIETSEGNSTPRSQNRELPGKVPQPTELDRREFGAQFSLSPTHATKLKRRSTSPIS